MSTNVAIIGAGNFGQALRTLFQKYEPSLAVTMFDQGQGSEHIAQVETLGNFRVVIIAVPIKAFENVVQQIGPHLSPGTLVIDVCSVKKHPADTMLRLLPGHVDIIASHPMFGPQTLGRSDWSLKGMNLVIYPLRVDLAQFENIVGRLRALELHVVEMLPEEHDRLMARSQFYSMLLGIVCDDLGLEPTEIDTPSFTQLMNFMADVKHDRGILRDMYQFAEPCRNEFRLLRSELEKMEKEFAGSQMT